jgi:hypothetical protein
MLCGPILGHSNPSRTMGEISLANHRMSGRRVPIWWHGKLMDGPFVGKDASVDVSLFASARSVAPSRVLPLRSTARNGRRVDRMRHEALCLHPDPVETVPFRRDHRNSD